MFKAYICFHTYQNISVNVTIMHINKFIVFDKTILAGV